MGKGAPLRWIENQILRQYFRGRGVEIGALWKRFPLPTAASPWYLDRLDPDQLGRHYVELKGAVVKPDIIADAAQLPFRDASLNFIIASHVLEHLHFPLSALRRWHDALAPGGVLLLCVPDKRHTFDRHRARTPITHLLDEEKHPEKFDRRAHFADWVQNVSGRSPASAEFVSELNHLMEIDYSIHYHVWTDADIKELIEYTRLSGGLGWKVAIFWKTHFYRKETVALLVRG
jgi:predicted SAM-dependent methyltransferase